MANKKQKLLTKQWKCMPILSELSTISVVDDSSIISVVDTSIFSVGSAVGSTVGTVVGELVVCRVYAERHKGAITSYPMW
mmetsp:Transcript_62350/g.99153  ORF Transcript_62350/g.99153 Transcript_62350/m.99153 type:complete len:80 (-) Transcript_62350:120-359(-)